MKVTPFEGEVKQAYGKKLETPLIIKGTFEKLEKSDVSLKEGLMKTKEWPTDEDIILGYINPRRLAKEKSKVTTEELEKAGHKKPEPSDPEVIYKNLLKQFKLAKMEKSAADVMARQVSGFTGAELEEEDEEEENEVPAEVPAK